jgi:2-dehydropantoate 2-reductase
MRVLVVGAGALGGYFGGRLVEAGKDVTFLVRPRRAEQIARHGLRIESPHGDADLRPRTVVAGGLDGPHDLILLAVKAYSLDEAMEAMAPAVGPTTAVLPLLNGVRHLDLLAGRFGRERVLGGAAVIAATLGPEGPVLQQMVPNHDLIFGELGAG